MKKITDYVIYENEYCIVINKPSGMLSQQATEGDQLSASELLQQKYSDDIHCLTRLDRPVSGVMLFSKAKRFTRHYLAQQNRGQVIKKYLAVVEGHYEELEKELLHHIVHDKKNKKARITPDIEQSRQVKLGSKLLKSLDNYSILELELNSGKFHQIRVQLAAEGYPIKGDVKYGARRGNQDRSIHLHAWSLAFKGIDNVEHNIYGIPDAKDTLWEMVNELITEKNNDAKL